MKQSHEANSETEYRKIDYTDRDMDTSGNCFAINFGLRASNP